MRTKRRWSLAVAAVLASSAVAQDGAEPPIRGTVVDEDGRPVAGAMVDLLGGEIRDGMPVGIGRVGNGPVPTGRDGGFVLRPDRTVALFLVRATADGGERLGVAVGLVRDNVPREPVRLVLRPSLPLTVRVADADGKPVAGAAVQVAALAGSAFGAVDPGTTDDRGVAVFRVPVDAPLQYVLALKDGVGVGSFSRRSGTSGVVTGPVPAEVSLTLRGGRTVTLRALDSGGRPIPGVAFRLGGIALKGEPIGLPGASRITEVTADASGIVRWRWVPEGGRGEVKIVSEELVEDAMPRLSSLTEGDVTFTVLLRRRARLSGWVFNADGSPARGVPLRAKGLGKFGDDVTDTARTGVDGSYTMMVRPERSYLVAVVGSGLAAEPVSDPPIGEGEHHGGINFRLIEGTRLHGQVEFPPGASRNVSVSLLGEEIPPGPLDPSGPKERLRLPIPATVDAQGRYEARLGPGDYEVLAPSHRVHPTIHVDGGGEFVLNFVGDLLPPPVALTGVVVEALPGGGERPAKASVQVAPGGSIAARTNADEAGRFTVRRPDEDIGLYARGAGGVAAVKVAKGVNEIKVVLGPSATASGRVVDAAGRPLSGDGPRMSLLGGPGLPPLSSTQSLSAFDRDGRYEFKGLIPGVEYQVFFLFIRDTGARELLPMKTFRVEGPGPIDLGAFVVPAAKP